MKLGKVIAHIPARCGSKRVPSKNLRYLAGKPLIAYAIENALACPELSCVYVNTDSDEIAALGKTLGCQVYRRPKHLGADNASGEDFTFDFIEAQRPDTLMMISPVCPLIDANDILSALHRYAESEADTLIACSETHMQTFCQDHPINIDLNGPLAPSQETPVVTVCNWAITIWNADVFRDLYKQNGSGYFGSRRVFWPLHPLKAVKISEETDFSLAEALMTIRGQITGAERKEPRYWKQPLNQQC